MGSLMHLTPYQRGIVYRYAVRQQSEAVAQAHVAYMEAARAMERERRKLDHYKEKLAAAEEDVMAKKVYKQREMVAA
jgi:hypothetical protein